MAKLDLTDISSGYASTTTINANNALIEAALENTLSRDGTSPNTMGANFDMNSNTIVNLADPVNPQEAATKAYVDAIDGLSATADQTITGNWTFEGTVTLNGTVTLASPLTETNGGTGISTYTTGDILYANGSDSLAVLPVGTNGQVLTLVGGVPAWADAGGGGATQLSELGDVSSSTPTNRNVLVANGSAFASRALVEADISDLQSYLPSVEEDGTPVLGGNLDGDGNNISNLGELQMQDAKISRPVIEDYGLEGATTSSSSNAVTFDFSTANAYRITLTENITTVTLSNPPASGTYGEMIIKVVQDSTARTITWPASVKWPGGTAPVISTGSGDEDIISLKTWDGGTTYYGNFAQAYS